MDTFWEADSVLQIEREMGLPAPSNPCNGHQATPLMETKDEMMKDLLLLLLLLLLILLLLLLLMANCFSDQLLLPYSSSQLSSFWPSIS